MYTHKEKHTHAHITIHTRTKSCLTLGLTFINLTFCSCISDKLIYGWRLIYRPAVHGSLDISLTALFGAVRMGAIKNSVLIVKSRNYSYDIILPPCLSPPLDPIDTVGED